MLGVKSFRFHTIPDFRGGVCLFVLLFFGCEMPSQSVQHKTWKKPINWTIPNSAHLGAGREVVGKVWGVESSELNSSLMPAWVNRLPQKRNMKERKEGRIFSSWSFPSLWLMYLVIIGQWGPRCSLELMLPQHSGICPWQWKSQKA